MNRSITILMYGLLFLLFLLLSSVDISGLKDSTQTGKFLVFFYAVLCASILYIFLIVFKKSLLKISWTDLLFLILFLYITVNRYIFQPDYAFSLRYYELIGLTIVYVLLRGANSVVYIYLFLGVISGGIIQAVYGNLQLYGYFPSNHHIFNITGSFFNPGPYGGYLASVFPAALGLYLYKDELVLKAASSGSGRKATYYLTFVVGYLSLAAIITLLLVAGASQSRAAWLAITGGAIFMLFKKYGLRHKVKCYLNTKAKINFSIIVTLLFLLVSLWGIYSFKQGSSDGRLLIWKVTVAMVHDSPWLGRGFDKFKSDYMDYQAQYFRSDPESKEGKVADNIYYSYNELLQFVAENGLIGLFLILALLILISRIKNTGNPLLIIAQGGLISVIVFSMFSYPAHILPIKLNAVLYLGILVSFSLPISIQFKRSKGLVIRLANGMMVCILATFFFLLVNPGKLLRGLRNWQAAYSLYQGRSYDESVDFYINAYPVFYNDGDFLTNYGKALFVSGQYENGIKILTQAQRYFNTSVVQVALGDCYKAIHRYELAEKAYYKAWYMVPARFYPKYLLAKLYDETDQKPKAVQIANDLLSKEVKIQSVAVQEMVDEMKKLVDNNSDIIPNP